MNNNIMILLKMMLPLIIINYALAAWCLWLIYKEGVRNLNRLIWCMIVLFANSIGSIAFLIVGRNKANDYVERNY